MIYKSHKHKSNLMFKLIQDWIRNILAHFEFDGRNMSHGHA